MNSDRTSCKQPRRVRHWLRQCVLALLLLTCIPSLAPADGLVTSVTSGAPFAAEAVAPKDTNPRTALWPFSRPHRRAIYDSAPGPATPHPAVARIIVPEKCATAYGSGTLVDVRDQYGVVVTNWHVVRDSQGVVEVVFPNGFRSHARPLKVDSDWDLAALVIWRPPIEPVKLATIPPRPGDLLTIHGYGQGQYRIATGRCTSYYAPHANFPLEMVELDVEARQGDSGGPIFNQRSELAGVLFGAGEGTTLGSFGPRVSVFLASLAPDIGQARDQAQVAVADRPAPNVHPAIDIGWSAAKPEYPSEPWSPPNNAANKNQLTDAQNLSGKGKFREGEAPAEPESLSVAAISRLGRSLALPFRTDAQSTATDEALAWSDVTGSGWYDPLKSALAVVGLVAIALQLVKVVR